jgi:hypothetical protein
MSVVGVPKAPLLYASDIRKGVLHAKTPPPSEGSLPFGHLMARAPLSGRRVGDGQGAAPPLGDGQRGRRPLPFFLAKGV